MNNLNFPRISKLDPEINPTPEGATPHKFWLVARNEAIADLRATNPRKWTLSRLGHVHDLKPSAVSKILKVAGLRPGVQRLAS